MEFGKRKSSCKFSQCAVQPVVQKEVGQLKLVSVALVSAMKNVLFVLESLAVSEAWLRRDTLRQAPRNERDWQGDILRQTQDDRLRGELSIEYNIYGPIKDKQYWEACEAQIKKLPPNITVNYHGDIAPDKIAAALAASHVFILPSKSENFGHAIYEALSAGRPVITSNNTPWNKLEDAKAGMNVSLTDTAELVQAIERFAGMGQEELEAWSKGARAYADSAVDVEGIRRQYEEMFSPHHLPIDREDLT
ncbi:MAG: glycosyltransferase [Chitinophagaceae bacterium]|nr:glycosyltransferase [Chitinophagaceae bacterium]